MKKSAGHICFAFGSAGPVEFFRSPNGADVARAPAAAPIFPDGRRPGRWECGSYHWRKFFRVILAGFDANTLTKNPAGYRVRPSDFTAFFPERIRHEEIDSPRIDVNCRR